MKAIVINGYKSFVGKNFYNLFKKKYKFFQYKEDINDIEKFKDYTKSKNFDYFVHFAGLSRYKCDLKKKLCVKTNFNSVKKIINHLNTLKKRPTFIFISSSHVYDFSTEKLKESAKKNPKSLYAELKLKTEYYIKKNYKKYCILRLFNIYGKDQPQSFFVPDMVKKIKNNQIINISKSSRDFINVNEVSNVIDFIISKEINTTLNVGTGKGITLLSIINKISKKLSIKPLIKINDKSDKLIADISTLKSFGYIRKYKEKNFNI